MPEPSVDMGMLIVLPPPQDIYKSFEKEVIVYVRNVMQLRKMTINVGQPREHNILFRA